MMSKVILSSQVVQNIPVVTPDAPGWAVSRWGEKWLWTARIDSGVWDQGIENILGLPQGSQLLFD